MIFTPNTCDGERCRIEFSWDNTRPLSECTLKNVTFVGFERRCPAHSGKTEAEDWAQVISENNRMNNFLGKIMSISTATVNVIQPDGSTVKQLKGSREYLWVFDSKRVMVVNLPGFTTTEKNALKTQVTNLWPGLIRIV